MTGWNMKGIPVLDPTEILDWDSKTKLGEGSFGVVYKVRYKKRDEIVAVKVTKKDHLASVERKKRQFAHEICISQQLNHRGCVKCYEVFQCREFIYMVIELVEGGELLDIIRKNGRLEEHHASRITRQLLEVLVYMHSKGIVHRDLKPENLLVTSQDLETLDIKVIDFGFSKFFGHRRDQPPEFNLQRFISTSINRYESTSHSPELVASAKGSLKYLAPEILKQIAYHGGYPRVSTRTEIQKLDIYAAGIVSYVMLCGRFPSRSRTACDILDDAKRGLSFDCQGWESVSAEAKDFCISLTNPQIEERPLAIEALRHEWVLVSEPPTPAVERPPTSVVFEEIEFKSCQSEHLIDALRREDSDIDEPLTDEELSELLGVQQEEVPQDIPQVPQKPSTTIQMSVRHKKHDTAHHDSNQAH
eukprot:NODE_3298_length_1378_cov_60.598406_g2866_i0.p1 GENE.NODE_3298_length_1378_cov_60.598406_g2866_i0~~NODE_3298_length_1378_cov_60.598406_g2866_i0.p1  ORF type:complete len:417 (+),score=75.52 NODE_3298_length_1378_cov_60.598406_g2866_i0:57-1307(+)